MIRREKHTNRVAVLFTDEQFNDVLRSAAKCERLPADWVRFEILRAMYGSVGVGEAAVKSIRNAYEAPESNDE